MPALLAMGKLSDRYSHLLLIATGCLAGIAYYLGWRSSPIRARHLPLEVLNAWFFAAVAGSASRCSRTSFRVRASPPAVMNTRRIGERVQRNRPREAC